MVAGNAQIDWQTELKNSLIAAVDDAFGEFKKKNRYGEFKFRPPGAALVNAFFRNWYRPHTFVFRKNIKVTNVQFGELTSLLMLHSKTKSHGVQKRHAHVLYQSSKEMKANFSRLWDSIYVPHDQSDHGLTNDRPTRELKKCATLADTYPEFFFDTILTDVYCGSCQIHIPRTMKIDLEAICGESGYIYCCGPTIYMRRPNKVSVSVLKEKIGNYLAQIKNEAERVPFILFSREQFPTHPNEDVRRSEHNGLDDLKFHLDKFYFGDFPVTDLHRALFLQDRGKAQDELDEVQRIVTQRSFYWQERHNSERRPAGTQLENSRRSIFLMIERPVTLGEPTMPSKRFFLCFAQEYTNRSQLIEFDESKPGWTAPTTIPHSLCAAMLNIARGSLERRSAVEQMTPLKILDLFCGVGTTLLEAAKYPELSWFLGVDKYDLNRQATKDNLQFFQLPGTEKKKLFDVLKKDVLFGVDPTKAWRLNPSSRMTDESTWAVFEKDFRKLCEGDWSKERDRLDDPRTPKQKFSWAYALATHEFEAAKSAWSGEHTMHMFHSLSSHEVGKPLSRTLLTGNFSLISRILFYICWKALLANGYALWAISESDSGDVGESYVSLRDRLTFNEIGKFLTRLDRTAWIENSDDSHEHQPIRGQRSYLKIQRGLYSCKTSIALPTLDSSIYDYRCLDVNDLKLDPEEKFNVIVTDPPYGFNVSGDKGSLPGLYKAMMKIMLDHISDGGQILFCVPRVPMNGQNIPSYMTSEFIVKQFILMAAHEGRRLLNPVISLPGGASVPSSDHNFRPPYYWESERALRRAVLHFQVFTNDVR